MKVICIYKENCVDGIAAALGVEKYFKNTLVDEGYIFESIAFCQAHFLHDYLVDVETDDIVFLLGVGFDHVDDYADLVLRVDKLYVFDSSDAAHEQWEKWGGAFEVTSILTNPSDFILELDSYTELASSVWFELVRDDVPEWISLLDRNSSDRKAVVECLSHHADLPISDAYWQTMADKHYCCVNNVASDLIDSGRRLLQLKHSIVKSLHEERQWVNFFGACIPIVHAQWSVQDDMLDYAAANSAWRVAMVYRIVGDEYHFTVRSKKGATYSANYIAFKVTGIQGITEFSIPINGRSAQMAFMDALYPDTGLLTRFCNWVKSIVKRITTTIETPTNITTPAELAAGTDPVPSISIDISPAVTINQIVGKTFNGDWEAVEKQFGLFYSEVMELKETIDNRTVGAMMMEQGDCLFTLAGFFGINGTLFTVNDDFKAICDNQFDKFDTTPEDALKTANKYTEAGMVVLTRDVVDPNSGKTFYITLSAKDQNDLKGRLAVKNKWLKSHKYKELVFSEIPSYVVDKLGNN